MEKLNLNEIQGIILRGYNHHPHSIYLFLQIEDAAKANKWLTAIVPEVTTSAHWPKGAAKPDTSLNIAFSFEGLKRLGYQDTTGTFSREFQQGMSEPDRARALGDTGESAPAKWELGGPASGSASPASPASQDKLHVLLMLYAASRSSLDQYSKGHKERISTVGGLALLCEQYCYLNPGHKEPFGFKDGLSQPEIEGFRRKPSDDDADPHAGEAIKAGEFILGYSNGYGQLPITPTVKPAQDRQGILPDLPPDPGSAGTPPTLNAADEVRDFGQNGSYLVYRKLEQDVTGFWKFMSDNAGSSGGAQKLAAKFMGRWPSGAPLVLAPDQDDPAVAADKNKVNSFNYHTEDPNGYKCPIGSHIRRSNPRDALDADPVESVKVVNRHRIIRRGRPYGTSGLDTPEPGTERKAEPTGIIFIAINASIKRQFEFVQQMWINDEKFQRMYDNKDGITGDNDDLTTMTIQREPVRRRILGVPRFVQVRGGGYFFVPSITGLKYLASLA
ncbi:MAG TPA: peroxidase [Blastocatellia bacterium]|nr:peroxidase [Blastocatellia bacterium]